MDYYKTGQIIRKFRKAHGLSQEELAEKTNISTTHMSHIETGSTKLSLPVLVDIALALGVKTDELLGIEHADISGAYLADISSLLEDCTAQQAKIILDIAKSAKLAMEKYL